MYVYNLDLEPASLIKPFGLVVIWGGLMNWLSMKCNNQMVEIDLKVVLNEWTVIGCWKCKLYTDGCELVYVFMLVLYKIRGFLEDQE